MVEFRRVNGIDKKNMKIAIIGGTGLLGSNLCHLYKKDNDVRCYSRKVSSNIENRFNKIIDFNNLTFELEKEFKEWKPDILINTVAIVNLQFCEENYDEAYNVNCLIAKQIAKISKEYDSYYIHISTDHLFNDEKLKHTESDSVVLLNNYAKTKYEAEIEVVKENQNSLVVRTNIVGFRRTEKESFFEWLLNSLLSKKETNFFTNFYTSPIEVKQLGKVLLKCYSKKLIGVYNIASSEVISKYDFAQKVCEKFNLDTNLIREAILSSDGFVQRALTLGLDERKIEKQLEIKMPKINEVINSLHKEYKKEDIYE